jgi:hypothetical protein
MPDLTHEEQLSYMRTLRDLYLDHIEGTDAEEFDKWSNLWAAADTIVRAMEGEL